MQALGATTQAGKVMAMLHGTGFGSGLAGFINGGLSHIPFIGNALAIGGTGLAAYTSIITTVGIGIGGMLLANYFEKREVNQPNDCIKWSKIIRYASLATSILIALPSILTGLSIGISFLAYSLGTMHFGNQVLGLMDVTLGSAGATASAGSLAAATLPHLLVCGAALLPVVGSFLLGKSSEQSPQSDSLVPGPTPSQRGWADRISSEPVTARAIA